MPLRAMAAVLLPLCDPCRLTAIFCVVDVIGFPNGFRLQNNRESTRIGIRLKGGSACIFTMTIACKADVQIVLLCAAISQSPSFPSLHPKNLLLTECAFFSIALIF